MMNPSKETDAEYLGDGLYVDQPVGTMTLRVCSFNGVSVLNEIFMERSELEAKRRKIIT